MTREEKFTVVTVYLAKAIDHLQRNEETQPASRALSSSHGYIYEAIGEIASTSQVLNDMKETE